MALQSMRDLRILAAATILVACGVVACGDAAPGDPQLEAPECPMIAARPLVDGDVVVVAQSDFNVCARVQDVRVQVDDQPWVTTDANGEARFSGVQAPYTVRIHQTEASRINPTRLFHDVWVLIDQTTDRVEFQADGTSTSRGCRVAAQVRNRSSEAASLEGGGLLPDAQDVLPYLVSWSGEDTFLESLVAYEVVRDSAGAPTSYPRFAVETAVFRDAQRDTFDDECEPATVSVDLEPVDNVVAEGLIETPSAMTDPDVLMVTSLDRRLNLNSFNPAETTRYRAAVPRISGAETWVGAFAIEDQALSQQTRRVTGASGTTTVDFGLPDLVPVLLPTEGSTVSAATPITWTPATGPGRYEVQVIAQFGDVMDDDSFVANYRQIQTNTTEVIIPSLPELSLPAGTLIEAKVIWYPDEGNGDGVSSNSVGPPRQYIVQ